MVRIDGRRARSPGEATCFSTTKLLVLAAVSGGTVGCGTPDFGLSSLFDQSCVPETCPVVDEDAGPNDARIELQPGSSLTLSIGNITLILEDVGGEVVLAGDLSCVPSAGAPCQATLKRLRIEIMDLEVPTDQGTFHVKNGVVSYQAPLSIEANGGGFVVPSGSTVHTCVNVDGVPEHDSATTTVNGLLWVSSGSQALSFGDTLPFVPKLGSDCSREPIQIAGQVVGATPWAQRPAP
jgi:hypothetical protein